MILLYFKLSSCKVKVGSWEGLNEASRVEKLSHRCGLIGLGVWELASKSKRPELKSLSTTSELSSLENINSLFIHSISPSVTFILR